MTAPKKATTEKPDRRRALPSVDKLIHLPALESLARAHGREPVVSAVRQAIADARGNGHTPSGDDGWANAVHTALDLAQRPTLRRVINATGVVLHTNLGRAPLAAAALDAVQGTASGYSSLEYNIESGKRGDRHVHCARLLCQLTGAEDALVVNNAAAALVLAIGAAAAGGEVIVSRGELIEIGGGFRIPEIMELGGARLVEVGTTNRTRVTDYEKALQKQAGTLLKVHRSNFQVTGFTAEASLAELVALGRKRRVSVLYDLGSGLVHELGGELAGEPTLSGAVKAGAHAVIASGDKLLGGPQAGIIVGRRAFVAACRRHPFARAARADKMTLAAMAATLLLYRSPAHARGEIPVLAMLTAQVRELEARAKTLADALPGRAHPSLVKTKSAVGGGAYPGVELESRGVALAPEGLPAAELAAKLRAGAVPLITIVHEGRVVLDVRSMLQADEADAVAVVRAVLA